MVKQCAVGPSARIVPMKVIVCGVHRTGTMSLRAALWKLGFHDCYHMHTVMSNLQQHPQQWIRALEAKFLSKGSFTEGDWDQLLGNCQACCDLPSAIFSAELSNIYPEAKVVILNRDPDMWYESAFQSVYKTMKPASIPDMLLRMYCYVFDSQMRNWKCFIDTLFQLSMGFDVIKDKHKSIAWFNARYEEFRTQIPADRRLEYTITDGWKPLCQHLGVEIPRVRNETTGSLVEVPFPRINDRETYLNNKHQHLMRSVSRANRNMLALVGVLALGGCLLYRGYYICGSGLTGHL